MERTESKNPLINYIYKMASSLKLNPAEILNENRADKSPSLVRVSEIDEDDGGGFA
jgi:hypothetical protein